MAYSANGLTADSTGNQNTDSYANPVLIAEGSAEIGLQLFQNTTTSVTPEPSSFALLATGILGVAGVIRKRLA